MISTQGSPRREIVEAGAGCGKTQSLVTRYLEALRAGHHPKDIWVLTFTNNSAQEMQTRIIRDLKSQFPELIGSVVEQSRIQTFHGLCLSLIGPHLPELGYTSKETISTPLLKSIRKKHLRHCLQTSETGRRLLEDFDSWDLIKIGLQNWGRRNLTSDFSREVSALQQEFSQWWQRTYELVTRIPQTFPEELSKLTEKSAILGLLEFFKTRDIDCLHRGDFRSGKKIISQWPEIKSIHKFLKSADRDFGWLECLLEPEKLGPELQHLNRLATFLEFAYETAPKFLDFQAMETELHRALESRSGTDFCAPPAVIMVDEFQDTNETQFEILTKLGNNSTEWYFVGDPKQAIYGFRGGDVKLFLRLKTELTALFNSTNYRSEPKLLEFMNLAQDCYFQRDNSLDPPPQHLSAHKTENSPLRQAPAQIHYGDNLAHKAHQLTWAIKTLQERLHDPALKNGSFAVLAGAWSPLQQLSDELTRLGISHTLSQPNDPLDHPLTKALVQLFRSKKSPAARDYYLAFCEKWAPSVGHDFIFLGEDPFESFEAFCQTHLPERWPQGRPWMSAMDRVLQHLKEVSWTKGLDLHDWAQFIDTTDGYEPALESLWSSESATEATSGLELMTIHSSKGLQFDSVIVLPSYDSSQRGRAQNSGSSNEDDEEESLVAPLNFKNTEGRPSTSLLFHRRQTEALQRQDAERQRLLYVALTRARKSVDVLLPPKSEPVSNSERKSRLWAFISTQDQFGLRHWPNSLLKFELEKYQVATGEPAPAKPARDFVLPEPWESAPQTWNRLAPPENLPTQMPYQRMGVSRYLQSLEPKSDFSTPPWPQESASNTQEKGTELHELLEVWSGEEGTLDSWLRNLKFEHWELTQLKKLALTLRSHPDLKFYWDQLSLRPQSILREFGVFIYLSQHRLSGFVDLVVLPESPDRELVLVDWKSSHNLNSLKKPVRIKKIAEQLSLYAQAFNSTPYKKIRLMAIGLDVENLNVETLINDPWHRPD